MYPDYPDELDAALLTMLGCRFEVLLFQLNREPYRHGSVNLSLLLLYIFLGKVNI